MSSIGQKKTARPRFALALGSAIAFAACSACAGPSRSTEEPSATVDLAAEERAAYESSIEHLEVEVREARREAQQLRDRLMALEATRPDADERCEQDLAVARAEVERYKAGLERAVDRLNEAPAGAAVPRSAPPRPTITGDSGRISSRLGPYLTWVGDSQLVAHGTLWSYRDAPTDVRLTLEVTERGRRVHQETIQLRVPANANAPYRHTLRFIAVPGREYLATASLDYP